MLRLSIPVRQALSRLTLPVMLLVSLGLVLIGRADQGLAGRLRISINDWLAPAYQAVSAPLSALARSGGTVGDLFRLEADNARLRVENDELRRWQSVALGLEAQNEALKSQLHYVPTPTPNFFTARVVADLDGVYARSVLVATPDGAGNVTGAIAMDGRGLVGRVVESGDRSARVLLITDLNSRIPVSIGSGNERALMIGNNDGTPALKYWSPGQPPSDGAMVLTSAVGGIFPPGLPVGFVHYDSDNQPVVVPLAQLDQLVVLRLFDYGPAAQPSLSKPVPRVPGQHR